MCHDFFSRSFALRDFPGEACNRISISSLFSSTVSSTQASESTTVGVSCVDDETKDSPLPLSNQSLLKVFYSIVMIVSSCPDAV